MLGRSRALPVIGFAVAALVYVATLFSLTDLKDDLWLSIFQTRDLARAQALLAGQTIFYGPEMTGGGNLPGPFYYVLLAAALAWRSDWLAAWSWLLILCGLGVGVTLAVLWRRISITAACTFLGLAVSVKYSKRVLDLFMNVSYALPFALVALVLQLLAFSPGLSARRRAYAFVGGAALTGLCLQLHFSLLALFVSQMLLAFSTRAWGLPALPRRARGLALLAFLAPSVPYVVWALAHRLGLDFGQPPFESGSADGALPSLLQLGTYTKAFEPLAFLKLAAGVLLRTVPLSLPLLLISFGGTALKGRTAKAADDLTSWPRVLAVNAFVGFVPFSYWFFASIGRRYGIAFFGAVLLLSTLLHERMLTDLTARTRYVRLAVGTLVALLVLLAGAYPQVFNLHVLLKTTAITLGPVALAAFILRELELKALAVLALTLVLSFAQHQVSRQDTWRDSPDLMPSFAKWESIWKNIYLRTGWSYDEAIHRLYFINHHLEQDPKPAYDVVVNDVDRRQLERLRLDPPPDGFFVVHNMRALGLSETQMRDWLLEQNLQSEVKEALRAGDIAIAFHGPYALMVLAYYVRDTRLVPKHFHNVGAGYLRSPDERALDAYPEAKTARPLGAGKYVFKWNECASAAPFCNAGVFVSLASEDDHVYRLRVRVVGSSLAQISPWVNPDWTAQWVAPFVEVACGSVQHHFSIASSIGFNRAYAGDPTHALLWGNNSFVAPLEREFTFACATAVKRVSVGREGTVVDTIQTPLVRPAQMLNLDI